METIIMSNTCVGANVIHIIYKGQYNNPFIATLIPNDDDYLKLCNNIMHYVTEVTPRLGTPCTTSPFCIQNGGLWYKHAAIPTPYPVIYLDDIEIHCIHESSELETLETFTRRLERMRDIMRTRPYRIIPMLSFGELFNNHTDIGTVIDKFMSSHSSHINPLFLGPSKYSKESYGGNYIIAHKWEAHTLTRDSSHVYTFNDQGYASTMLIDAIQRM